MEILTDKNYEELLECIPRIESSLKEWQIVDIKLDPASAKNVTIDDIAETVHKLFQDKEGKLFISADNEIFLLVRTGLNTDPMTTADKVEHVLPKNSCDVLVNEPTAGSLSKIQMRVKINKPRKEFSLADIRRTRHRNVIMIADDDMYVRKLVKKGMESHVQVNEVVDGNEVLAAYREYVPDVVFLDIHMPSKDGTEVLKELLIADPQAYVIMLSADSSLSNVEWSMRQGAKGFLTKPFTRGKLLEYISRCPTIS
ncbi:MAG TPA: response regulator [Patescibacteria group bacterium]|nr:response regulator [Patescibacteria group bacterium]